jgi:hypothetical protein
MPPFQGISDVKVQLYSVAYRNVLEQIFHNVASGQDVSIDLISSANHPFSGGLYYVVVTTNNGRTIGKLIVLR